MLLRRFAIGDNRLEKYFPLIFDIRYVICVRTNHDNEYSLMRITLLIWMWSIFEDTIVFNRLFHVLERNTSPPFQQFVFVRTPLDRLLELHMQSIYKIKRLSSTKKRPHGRFFVLFKLITSSCPLCVSREYGCCCIF